MESGAEPRDRVPEGEPISSSRNVVIREIGSTDHVASPAGSTKPGEKKKESHSSRSSMVQTPHHRSSHTSSGGALDLQAVVGRSSSSISGITVPIRLDALSYLLNNAVVGNYRMPCQMPCYPSSYPCSYPQMGCSPYGMCMGSQYCSSTFPNQHAAYQTGPMACGNQQNIQAFQHPIPNFNQCMNDTSQIQSTGTFPGGMAFSPTGMAFNSAGTSSVQNSSGAAQPECSSWAKNPLEKAGTSEKFGSNWSNSFSFESEKQSSPRRGRFGDRKNEDRSPRGGFGRFGDNKNEDSWSSRQQSNSFGKDFDRGRGSFGGSSWRGNSRGQNKEWTFGDRSREFGNKRRFGENTESFQDQGTFSKRGQWSGGRGRGRESPDSWQQKNRQKDSPMWSSTADTPSTSTFGQVTKTAAPSDAGDEDWETDYPEKPKATELGNTSEIPVVQSPVPCSPTNNCEKVNESSDFLKPAEDFTEELTTGPETEEQNSEFSEVLEPAEGFTEELTTGPETEEQNNESSEVLKPAEGFTEELTTGPETEEQNNESSEVLKPAEGFREELTTGPETEEPQTDVNSGKSDATVELETKAEDQDSTLIPAITSEHDDQDEEIYTFIVTVDGEEDRGVLVEVNGEKI